MLNHSVQRAAVRFMQTVEDLGANGFYDLLLRMEVGIVCPPLWILCKGTACNYESQRANLDGAGVYEWEQTRKRIRVFGRRL